MIELYPISINFTRDKAESENEDQVRISLKKEEEMSG